MRLILIVMTFSMFCVQAQESYPFKKVYDNPFNQPKDYPESTTDTKGTTAGETLEADRVENIYIAYGYITTIKLKDVNPDKVPRIRLGAPIATVTWNKAEQTIDIFPNVTEGATNMNITIGDTVYVFILKIVSEGDVNFRRTFSFTNSKLQNGTSHISQAKPVAPGTINTTAYIKMIEKSRLNATYRDSLGKSMLQYPLDRVYNWNQCLVYLVEAYQFPSDNLVILKVVWQNIQANALYMNAQQIGVFVANKEIPITARKQQSLDGTVLPGQMDTIWLFIQGYNLSGDNDFSLTLPPDTNSVKKAILPE